MTTTTAAAATTRTTRTGRRWRQLALHYLEMVAAMLAGMAVLGSVRGAIGLDVAFHDRPGVSFLLMSTDMALGMAAWMAVRRHGWPITFQMCAAMYVPLLLLPLVAADLMGAMTFMVVAHVVMCLTMLLVLLAHREHS